MEDPAKYEPPSMLVHNMNIKDIRQAASHDDSHMVSLYEDIPHSQGLSCQHSTQPEMYDGSGRVSLTDQIKLYESPIKLYEYPILLGTTPPHRKTSPHDVSSSMTNHSFSPTRRMKDMPHKVDQSILGYSHRAST